MPFLQPLLWFVFFLIPVCEIHAQKVIPETNTGKLDAGVCIGPSFPVYDHKSGYSVQTVPTQCALPWYAIRVDAHAGILHGWKTGLVLQAFYSNMDEDQMGNYLKTTLDTIGYSTNVIFNSEGYFSSTVFSAEIEKDIIHGSWQVSPHVALGLTSLQTGLDCDFSQGERGTDYVRYIHVSANRLASISAVVTAGMKVGYRYPWLDGKLFFHIAGDYMQYRSTMGLEYRMKDNQGNATNTQQWFSGNVRNFALMFGGTYYLK